MKRDFPAITDIIAYGGETLSPPKYRTIIISAILNNIEQIPQSTIDAYKRYLKPRSGIPFIAEFVDPTFINVKLNASIDVAESTVSNELLKSLVIDKINTYANDNVGRFNGSFHESKILTSIDDAHNSINGSNIQVELYKKILGGDVRHSNIKFSYGNQISKVYSDSLLYNNQPCKIIDVLGELFLVSVSNSELKIVNNSIGNIDYKEGTITLNQLAIDNTVSYINLYTTPLEKNINSKGSNVLRLNSSDVSLSVNR
jgi:hypothetical protein